MFCCHGRKAASEGVLERVFSPEYDVKPLTLKFYAKHDTDVSLGPYEENIPKYEATIHKRQIRILPNDTCPVTTNQHYGWLYDKVTEYTDELDKSLFIRRHHTDKDIELMITINLSKNKKYL